MYRQFIAWCTRNYSDPLARLRVRILAVFMAITVPIALLFGLYLHADTATWLLFCFLTPPVLGVFILALQRGAGPGRTGTFFGLYMEALFIESLAVLGTQASIIWVAFVPFVIVFTSGRKAGAACFLAAAVAIPLLHLSNYLFDTPFPLLPLFFNAHSMADLVSFSLFSVILLVFGIRLEVVVEEYIHSWLQEKEQLEQEIQKRTGKEKELAGALGLLETIFSALPIPVILKDTDSRYLRCSRAFLSFVDKEEQDIIGHGLDAIWEPEIAAIHREVDFSVVSDSSLHCYSFPMRRPSDGSQRTMVFLKTPVHNQDGATIGIIGIMVDETERIQVERSLRRLADTRREALSLVGHDLRNPIGSFRALVQSIQEEGRVDPGEMNEILMELGKSLDSLWKLLDELLSWAQSDQILESFQPEELDLENMLSEVASLCRQAATQKALAFTWELQGPASLRADRRMLTTILRNLCANAIKFTPRGGRVDLLVTQHLPDALEKRAGMLFHVKDTGIGMSDSYIAALLDSRTLRSRRGTEGEPGTGLGFQLCKRLAERHGGSIDVSSQEGVGSIFRVFIPEQMP